MLALNPSRMANLASGHEIQWGGCRQLSQHQAGLVSSRNKASFPAVLGHGPVSFSSWSEERTEPSRNPLASLRPLHHGLKRLGCGEVVLRRRIKPVEKIELYMQRRAQVAGSRAMLHEWCLSSFLWWQWWVTCVLPALCQETAHMHLPGIFSRQTIVRCCCSAAPRAPAASGEWPCRELLCGGANLLCSGEALGRLYGHSQRVPYVNAVLVLLSHAFSWAGLVR